MKVKKWLLGFMTFAAMAVLCVVCAGAEEYSSGLWRYTKQSDGTVYISAYSGFDSNLTVPSKIDGYTVTGIDDYAFSENRNITNVTLPKTIAVIGNEAFKESSVKKVEIPNSVTTIGYDAFRWSDIVSIDVPASVTEWGTMYTNSNVFSECTKLTSVTFNSSCVPKSAFYSCSSLKSVTLGRNVKTVESYAFENCTSLVKLTNYDNIEYIGDCSFKNAPITNFKFTDNLYYIGERAFSNTKLKQVRIPKSVTEWGESYSYSNAFENCANLTCVEIYCKSIPKAAFISCNALNRIVIGENVASIGDLAFRYTAIKQLVLPDELIYIGYYAFSDTSLEYVSIPSSIKNWGIEDMMGTYFCSTFANCMKLKKVIIGSCVMPEQTDLFSGSNNVTIYCIKDSEAYKYAKNNGINCVSTFKAIPTKSIKFSKEEYTLCKGETLKLYPIVSPANTTDSFKWISGNTDIITIDSNGNITANGTGTAALKYQASNGVYGYCTINVVNSGTTTPDTVRKKDVALSTVSVANQFYTGKAIKPSVSVNFNSVTPLLLNRDYTVTYANNVKIGTAKITIKGIGNYTGTVTKTFKITKLPKVSGAKLGGRAADALRVNWTRNASADGYIVEMYKNGKWVRAAKITNKNTTTFRKAGLKASTVYKFRVRAYKMIGSVAAYSDYTATITARTNPSIMKGVKIAGKARDALRVNWTKNTSAQGYIVEMYKGGKWVRVAKITNNNTTTFRKAGLAKNTTYKFRVRAYHMSGKTALYGNYGNVSGRTLVR